jgi:hypothetical protein
VIDVTQKACSLFLGIEQADFSRPQPLPITSQVNISRYAIQYMLTYKGSFSSAIDFTDCTVTEAPFQFVFTPVIQMLGNIGQTIPMTTETLKRLLGAMYGKSLNGTLVRILFLPCSATCYLCKFITTIAI